MIIHIMKDGTRRDSINGYVVKYEQKKELYKHMTKGCKRNVNSDTCRDIRKK